jgi:hypothetical protein
MNTNARATTHTHAPPAPLWWAPNAWMQGPQRTGWHAGVCLQADVAGHWSHIQTDVPTHRPTLRC